MRYAVLSLLFIASGAFAKSQVEAHPQKSHDGDGYEVVIDGDVAEKLFLLLEAPAREVETSDGNWLNKNAQGILCGQNQKTEKFFCSMYVDRSGIQE